MRIIAITLLSLFGGAVAAAEVTLHTEKSLYQNISVVEEDGVRCLRFTVKRRNSRQSCIDVNNPDRLVLPYTHLMFGGLLVNPAPQRVLLIGLGGGTLVEVFTGLFPGIEIDAVEIDPAVVDVARKYFSYSDPAGTAVHVRDGRVFARRANRRGERYDYIIIDAFNGDYIPEHLMTREFLLECKELLAEKGVLVANTFSSSRLYNSESATYASVFGEYLNLRRPHGNRVIVAGRDGLPPADWLRLNINRVDADLARFGIDLPRLLSLDRGIDWRRKARILTDQYAPANLMRDAAR
ncbi:MAG: fused MFS/spermidine synthase [Gammaproteobacteria bacterium]|nr:fused MFS/spermidine synthase [Gammaproteobacteria bacterium]NNF60370.1 fused MFS/spermidine synthase [Gammaproteobacteria bacterium]